VSNRPNSLNELEFENLFTRTLPADPEVANYCRQVMGACYSRVKPVQVSRPQTVAYAREVADLLNLSIGACESPEFSKVFAGNKILKGMDPYAMCYGGHQFGNWAGQLGDGRAINLAETVNPAGDRWTLQLKGAGPTPYSRSADGFAVLRSSVREFLCSEAMHHLGVPTTRALSLVLTGEEIERDMFYDGNSKYEPGAVVCRVAPSFIRFGNFQIFASRGETDLLRQLLDYTIQTDFSHLGNPSPKIYCAWFEEVCRTTAELVVHWMRVGFVHGVLNTDNMSILGLTIDYGPYGWLEGFDPNWTPNTTDAGGRRYRFGTQPQIAHWNLAQLGQAILPLVNEVDLLQAALNTYETAFENGWQSMMARKLGLIEYARETDDDLIADLQKVLQVVETDMTIFYRRLATMDFSEQSTLDFSNEELVAPLLDAYYSVDQVSQDQFASFGDWIRRYLQRVRKDGEPHEARRKRMDAVNPKYVLRNYLAQLAIDKSELGDHSMVNELLDVLRHPYDEQPEYEEYAQKRPEWARNRAGCSMLSCSS